MGKGRLEAFSDGVIAIALTIIACHGGNKSLLASAVGRDLKAKLSLAGYVVAIGLAFVTTLASDAIYLAIALMWLIPDRRIQAKIAE